MDRLVNVVVRVIERVVIVLMGIVVCTVVAEVVARGLFSKPLVISDELSRYLMIWTAMLSAVLLVHEDGHMRITVLSAALTGRAAGILDGIASLMAASFLMMLAGTTIRILPEMQSQSMVTIGASMAWVYGALPIASLLMLPLLLRRAWRGFTTRGQTGTEA